jgi:hypothetical protein
VVKNVATANFLLATPFQSWQKRCDENKNCISNGCRKHTDLR